eukprot:11778258-Alexandrium_andersonii.AAC.1
MVPSSPALPLDPAAPLAGLRSEARPFPPTQRIETAANGARAATASAGTLNPDHPVPRSLNQCPPKVLLSAPPLRTLLASSEL